MDVFINSLEAISPQNTFNTNEFLPTYSKPEKEYFTCLKPDYKAIINVKQLRRMGSIVRMGVACSVKVLQTAGIEQPDAIIVGTGLGCLEDTFKFLDQIIENNESLLNPTAFIQSTHNTVSGQIALLLGCKNYNFTFTQQSVSFETALLDAIMQLQELAEKTVLLGGLDEITEKTYELLNKAGCTKAFSGNIYQSNTKGYVPGEGASFFSLSNKISNKNIACISAISLFNQMKNEKALPVELEEALLARKISIKDVDVLISGLNGDISEDKNYFPVQEIFKESVHVRYKHLIGEFDTASGFAMWLGTKMIQHQAIPEIVKINKLNRNKVENVLIHNYSKTHHHSFILLSKC